MVLKYKFTKVFNRTKKLFSEKSLRKTIGYARFAANSIKADRQIEALQKAGCSFIFQEATNFINEEGCFPVFQEAIDSLKRGDEILLTTLDRIGTSEKQVMANIHFLQIKGIHIRTLDGLVDTKDLGELSSSLIGLLFSISKVEGSITKEKNLARIEHQKQIGGKVGGRPKTNPAKENLVVRLRVEGDSYRTIRNKTGLALSTIRRILTEKEISSY